MSLQQFVEETLELCIDYGATGGPNFNTSVVTTRSGIDYRNVNWDRALGQWEIGDRVVTKAELDYLMSFFLRRRGQAIGFRFKDWGDYEITDQQPELLNPTEYQLVKTYGASDLEEYTVKIEKPVTNKVTLYNNGNPILFGWSISSTTGVIRLDQPITGRLTVDAEFDKPARFSVDSFEHEFQAYDEATNEALYNVTSIPVTELRTE